jgi:hypothetical protein
MSLALLKALDIADQKAGKQSSDHAINYDASKEMMKEHFIVLFLR